MDQSIQSSQSIQSLQSFPSTHASATDSEPVAANQNPAIARCYAAFQKTYHTAFGRKADGHDAHNKGKLAFREALPPLISRTNIRNFIACVTYGLAIELISSGDGMRLLTAARTAACVLYRRTRQKAVNNAQKSVENQQKVAFRVEKMNQK
jgi:hypothetical protein